MDILYGSLTTGKVEIGEEIVFVYKKLGAQNGIYKVPRVESPQTSSQLAWNARLRKHNEI